MKRYILLYFVLFYSLVGSYSDDIAMQENFRVVKDGLLQLQKNSTKRESLLQSMSLYTLELQEMLQASKQILQEKSKSIENLERQLEEYKTLLKKSTHSKDQIQKSLDDYLKHSAQLKSQFTVAKIIYFSIGASVGIVTKIVIDYARER